MGAPPCGARPPPSQQPYSHDGIGAVCIGRVSARDGRGAGKIVSGGVSISVRRAYHPYDAVRCEAKSTHNVGGPVDGEREELDEGPRHGGGERRYVRERVGEGLKSKEKARQSDLTFARARRLRAVVVSKYEIRRL